MYSPQDCQRSGVSDLNSEETAQRVQIHNLDQVPPIFGDIEDKMKRQSFRYKDRFAVMLALREAVTNAVRHGNGSDPAKAVFITYAVRSREVVIAVEDEGLGFDPDTVPSPVFLAHPERGRRLGLFFMRAYTDWLTYSPRGNRVTFGRWRSDR